MMPEPDIIGETLHGSGYAVALARAYFDESIAYKGRRILCVAGYIIKASQTKPFSRKWNRVLKRYRLPYFRMSACAHGNYPFNHLSPKDRVDVEKHMIACIKRRTTLGVAISVDVDEFERLSPKSSLLGSPYTFCVHWIIGGVIWWIRQSQYRGKVAYFFEAGHKSQSEANKIMDKVFCVPQLRESARYASHGFVEKAQAPVVQAADLLAWQWYTDLRHRHEGKPRRKDLESLLQHQHRTLHIRPGIIRHLAETWGSEDNPAESLLRFHLGDDALNDQLASGGELS